MGLNSTSGEIKDSEISGNVRNGNNKISHNISQTTEVHGIPTDISNQDRSDKQTDLKHSNSQKVKVFFINTSRYTLHISGQKLPYVIYYCLIVNYLKNIYRKGKRRKRRGPEIIQEDLEVDHDHVPFPHMVVLDTGIYYY